MELWSATARIGEAKAALYPSIKLTGSYGLASTDLSELVNPASQTWNIFASLLQPIFAGGALRGKVDVRQSQQRQAVYAYERTLLQALREVEDALISLRKMGQQREEQRERTTAEIVRSSSSPSFATRAESATTRRCSTRNARCSTPRSTMRRQRASTRAHWSSCTRLSARAGQCR